MKLVRIGVNECSPSSTREARLTVANSDKLSSITKFRLNDAILMIPLMEANSQLSFSTGCYAGLEDVHQPLAEENSERYCRGQIGHKYARFAEICHQRKFLGQMVIRQF